MSNPFGTRTPALSGPATDILPATLNDGHDLSHTAVALYAEVGGTRSDEVPDFGFLPVGVRRVRAAGTTASGIHALMLI